MIQVFSRLLFFCGAIVMAGCSEAGTLKPNPAETVLTKDTTLLEIEGIYTAALEDYLNIVLDEYQLSLDTLYVGNRKFGQPDDFPDITLPDRIGKTVIRLVNPESGMEIQKRDSTAYYINMMGFLSPRHTEFIIVAFSRGMAHQFDVKLNYQLTSPDKWELVNTSTETYLFVKPKGNK
ncbi:MAG: hypothetical protein JNM00_03480 [Flavobacteriales bacterium]|nr:hypothetical protein [Flavobacteriales bacterium]